LDARPDRSEDCFWYDVIDAPSIGVTPGCWDLRREFSAFISQVDPRDRSVLDIGTATDCLSLSTEQTGARTCRSKAIF
jgi:hypothetical protein